MAFRYDRLFALLRERDIKVTELREKKVVSQASLTKMRNGVGNIDTRTLDSLCGYLKCQPNDIMEYYEVDTKE